MADHKYQFPIDNPRCLGYTNRNMQRKNHAPRRRNRPIISPEGWASFLTLAAMSVLAAVGVPLAGPEIITPLVSLLATTLVLNLALFWLERRYGPSRLLDWVGYLGNPALITVGLHLSWGLSSPYLPLYAVYIITGAFYHGRRGATLCVALSVASLLALLALGHSLALEPLVRLAINAGLSVLTGVVAGTLGQRRIDAVRSAERRAAELAVLNQIGRAINANVEVDCLLEEIRRQTGRLMDVSNFYVALQDEETGQLLFPLFYSDGQQEARPPESHDQGLAGYVVRTREPLLLSDAPRELADLRLEGTDACCLSWLGVPMIMGEKVLGVIAVQSDEQASTFDSGHVELLQTIASQAAVALENARLYQELKARAEQLHSTYEELQALDRQRTEFVQDISHDLRAPLTFLQSYVELFLKEEVGPLTETQRSGLKVIAEKTHLLTKLAESIVSLQRLTLAPETLLPVSLTNLAKAALQSAEPTAQAAGIALRSEFDGGVRPVLGDPIRIAQVFDNLMSNALKYTPAGGTVTIQVRDAENEVEVTVADTGVGIPPEAHARIFDRFYRVQEDNHRAGLGLGLAIVKEVIEAHGGHVRVESEPGQGSTFFFTLPSYR